MAWLVKFNLLWHDMLKSMSILVFKSRDHNLTSFPPAKNNNLLSSYLIIKISLWKWEGAIHNLHIHSLDKFWPPSPPPAFITQCLLCPGVMLSKPSPSLICWSDLCHRLITCIFPIDWKYNSKYLSTTLKHCNIEFFSQCLTTAWVLINRQQVWFSYVV